jgi:DNA replication licensing factor MCM5
MLDGKYIRVCYIDEMTYCQCISKCAPRLSAEAGEMLSNHFVAIRSQVREMESMGSERSSIPITVR